MSNQIKNGKLPLSSKPRAGGFVGGLDDIFGNQLSVAPEIQKAITDKGLCYRWVDYRKLVDNGGAHERGWRAIKRSECGTLEGVPSFGNDPEGYFRRGSMILAVRPKELNDKHVAFLRQEANRSSNIQRKHAQELRDYAKSTGIDMKISEGYED